MEYCMIYNCKAPEAAHSACQKSADVYVLQYWGGHIFIDKNEYEETGFVLQDSKDVDVLFVGTSTTEVGIQTMKIC